MPEPFHGRFGGCPPGLCEESSQALTIVEMGSEGLGPLRAISQPFAFDLAEPSQRDREEGPEKNSAEGPARFRLRFGSGDDAIENQPDGRVIGQA